MAAQCQATLRQRSDVAIAPAILGSSGDLSLAEQHVEIEELVSLTEEKLADDEQVVVVTNAREGEFAPVGRESFVSTTTSLVSIMIGASILGYPAVFSRNGMLLGSCVLVLSCVVSLYLCHRLSEAIVHAQSGFHVRIYKLEDLADVCFGHVGQCATRALLNAYFIAKVCMYLVLIGQNMNYIFPGMPYKGWVLMATCLALPSAFLRDVSAIARLLSLSVLATFVYLVCIMSAANEASTRTGRKFEMQQGFSNAQQFIQMSFSALTMMIFGFGPTDVLTTVRREMSQPNNFLKALVVSHFVVMFIYWVAGAYGFWGFGLTVAGNVNLSMCGAPGCEGQAGVPAGQGGAKWIWGYVLAGAVVLNLAATIPIVLYCVFTGVESGYPPEAPMPKLPNMAMRAGSVIFCSIVGLSLPFFLQCLALVSSALSVPVIFFVPLMLSWKVARDTGALLRPMRLVCDGSLLILGVVAFLVGVTGSVSDLLTAMHDSQNTGGYR